MQTAQRGDPVGTRTQHQVVRVPQDAVTSRRPDGIGRHCLDGSGGADSHERRSFDRAMSGLQDACPRVAVDSQGLKAVFHSGDRRHIHPD